MVLFPGALTRWLRGQFNTVLVLVFAILVLFYDANLMAQKNTASLSDEERISRKINRFNIDYEGDVEFSDDDRSIKSISRGGFFRVKSTSFGKRREILAEPDIRGTINYEYYYGGRRGDFGTDGKKWLSDILLEVIRTSGMGAEMRTERIFRQKGVDASLREIGNIKSNYVSHLYLSALLSIEELSEGDLKKVADFIPKDLSSDQYIAQVFKNNYREILKNDEALQAFVLGIISRMSSDLHISIIFKRILRREQNGIITQRILERTADMDSDFYKSDILKYVFDARLSKINLLNALKSVGSLGSDHSKSEMLKRACFQVSQADTEVRSMYRKVAEGIRSDSYFGQVMRCVNR